mmetsp:Transcript_11666/g.28744  ORF Transcript_11666/g.28744 Transcript_11666/m.28744 type:complete len:369 (-) Transcript_11666:152-1258(-)
MNAEQIIGVGIEVVGTSVTTTGLNLMKLSMKEQSQTRSRDSFCSKLCAHWKWWGAFTVFIMGQLLESLALYFSTQTVMATASNFAFVANAICAYTLFGEKITTTDLLGSLCMVLGTVVVLFSAPTLEKEHYKIDELRSLMAETGFLIALTLQLCAALLAFVYVSCVPRRPSNSGGGLPAIAYGVMSACMASITITFSKIILLLVQTTIESPNDNQFVDVAPWLYLILWAVFQVLTIVSLNEGLRQYDALMVIPVYTVGRTLLVVVSGLSLYQLWDRFTSLKGLSFALGMVTCIVSVLSLDAERQRDQREQEVMRTWNVVYDDDEDPPFEDENSNEQKDSFGMESFKKNLGSPTDSPHLPGGFANGDTR